MAMTIEPPSRVQTRDAEGERTINWLHSDRLSVERVLAIQRAGQRIHPRDSQLMFELAGVDRERFLGALRQMARNYLPRELRDAWSEENPTRNYCYVIAEWVWHWHSPIGAVSYSLVVDDPAIGDTKHYFVRLPDQRIIDLAAEQFDDYFKVEYRNGKRQRFRTVEPSNRARVLARLYGDNAEQSPKTAHAS